MAHEVAHHFQQIGQRLLAVYEERGRDVAGANQVQRFLDVRGVWWKVALQVISE